MSTDDQPLSTGRALITMASSAFYAFFAYMRADISWHRHNPAMTIVYGFSCLVSFLFASTCVNALLLNARKWQRRVQSDSSRGWFHTACLSLVGVSLLLVGGAAFLVSDNSTDIILGFFLVPIGARMLWVAASLSI